MRSITDSKVQEFDRSAVYTMGNGPTFGRNGQVSFFIWLAGTLNISGPAPDVKINHDTKSGLDNPLYFLD